MRREERVTVQGPVKKQQPDGMSHRGIEGSGHGGRFSAIPNPNAHGGGTGSARRRGGGGGHKNVRVLRAFLNSLLHFLFGSDEDELAKPAQFTVLKITSGSRFRAVQCCNDPTSGSDM